MFLWIGLPFFPFSFLVFSSQFSPKILQRSNEMNALPKNKTLFSGGLVEGGWGQASDSRSQRNRRSCQTHEVTQHSDEATSSCRVTEVTVDVFYKQTSKPRIKKLFPWNWCGGAGEKLGTVDCFSHPKRRNCRAHEGTLQTDKLRRIPRWRCSRESRKRKILHGKSQ